MSKIRVAVVFAFMLSMLAVPAFAQDDGDDMVMQACQADIQQSCAGQEGDALDDCLDTNYDQLSDACKQALDADDEGEEGEEGDAQEGEQQ